ncbi:MAG TPA: DUF5916 domain-containing protein [Bacteroidota bacterium]|nr:DUF5916 domain-containing protein [Bacteroidota bacterium]
MKSLAVILLAVLMCRLAVAAESPSWRGVRTATPPTIDGTLEDVWNAGALPSHFKQITPAVSSEATVPTQVYFLYDDDAVYIAARMMQSRATLHSVQGNRDSKTISQGDHIRFIIDPSRSGTSGYFFIISAANGVSDGTMNSLGDWDTAWDAPFTSATTVTDSAWYVELRIPLSSLSFQNKDMQDWYFFAARRYAQNQEIAVISLHDINNPFRITDFPIMYGLEGLRKNEAIALVPYSYASAQTDFLANSSQGQGKLGADIRYSPSPSTTLLATIRPDYAQLESDRDIINVDDVPVSYPEKRPFFTASSDLYPGLAVNTRNITDIKAGMKLRTVLERVKYDLTGVLDGSNALWLLGNFRTTNNESYYVDLIGGMKQGDGNRDYNITTNIRTWMFDKRLTAYTWFGTINGRRTDRNEWESVNSLRWVTRTLNIGYWNHLKTQFYNPNIVGHSTLSNEVQHHGWLSYSFIEERGFLRVVMPSVRAEYFDLYTHPGNGYLTWKLSVMTTLHISEAVGEWNIVVLYRPGTTSMFRFRALSDGTQTFEDAYSAFVLVGMKKASFAVNVTTDQSKRLGGQLMVDTRPVRASGGTTGQIEGFYRFSERFTVRYALEYVNLSGSQYQSQFRQIVHRALLEYSIGERMTLRGVLQLNSKQMPATAFHSANLTTNFTFSWEFEPGSFLYCVYHQNNAAERATGESAARGTASTQTIALKISKQLSF